MASPTQMHNVLCRSVTIEARFTASSRSSGSHRDWTDLYRASNRYCVSILACISVHVMVSGLKRFMLISCLYLSGSLGLKINPCVSFENAENLKMKDESLPNCLTDAF
jgi:hypothetical protein